MTEVRISIRRLVLGDGRLAGLPPAAMAAALSERLADRPPPSGSDPALWDAWLREALSSAPAARPDRHQGG